MFMAPVHRWIDRSISWYSIKWITLEAGHDYTEEKIALNIKGKSKPLQEEDNGCKLTWLSRYFIVNFFTDKSEQHKTRQAEKHNKKQAELCDGNTLEYYGSWWSYLSLTAFQVQSEQTND